jgi:hypothetical protein
MPMPEVERDFLTIIAGIAVAFVVPLIIKSGRRQSSKLVLIVFVGFGLSIEVFAFFFLRLYKVNLEDTKFYQNELTNIDSKLIALKTTLIGERDNDVSDVVRELAGTERNFVLKKDETTVELERTRIERSTYKETIDGLVALAEKMKPKIGT